MAIMTVDYEKGRARLREPFAAHQIGKLPKPFKSNAEKGKCRECDGYHGLPAMHLDFVGHAALTDRFLEVDPEWTWEPMGVDAEGLPQFDKIGGLWIRLTLCGVTRVGYGHPDGKSGGNAIKEAIGDALRNAGMRFGAALDLWHKGDLHDAAEEQGRNAESAPDVKPAASKPAAAKPKPASGNDDPWGKPPAESGSFGSAATVSDMRAAIITAARTAGKKPAEVTDLVKECGGKGGLSTEKDVEVLGAVYKRLTGQSYQPPF